MITYTKFYRCFLFLVTICYTYDLSAQGHPYLSITNEGIADIKKELGNIPIFDNTLQRIKDLVDKEISLGIIVPVPKDRAGGYTHERHKKNWDLLYKSGVLFQITNEDKYAQYVHNMLKAYAKMYPQLPLHPYEKSYARGKLFWQCLNDANWLVFASQAYDCIYNFLNKKERQYLEKNLFIPFANFLSIDNPQFFNRIHNHSTWGNVAVGMIGLAMNNNDLVNRALYGLKDVQISEDLKDNDGGNIIEKNQEAGFIANLKYPFSVDGYYTEGPYYQRYAMYPFMIFAQALANTRPELNIFEHKNNVLIKAVYALLNLTDIDGEFFPINDAQKGMSIYAKSVIPAVDIAYYYGNKDPQLLTIAEQQGQVLLNKAGLSIAIGLRDKKQRPFHKTSVEYTDGASGDEGGLTVLRSEEDNVELVYKYTAQGLSHGHYDKLSFSLFHNGHEVFQDYGLARFVNVEQKNGGGYLKENNTWAKQTIAHNTIVQDEESHFKGEYSVGSLHHSNKVIVDFSNKDMQVVSAMEDHAYKGTELQRTLIMMRDEEFEHPVLLDIFRFSSDTLHQYDLPYYYQGQIITSNVVHQIQKELKPLGESNGYEHLWLEGSNVFDRSQMLQNTWLDHQTFYSISSAVKKNDELLFVRLGANDPNFNLRRDPAFVLRKKNTNSDLFCSVMEIHGSYSPVLEKADNSYSHIEEIKSYTTHDNHYAVCVFRTKQGTTHIFVFSLKDRNMNTRHSLTVESKNLSWKGFYTHLKEKNIKL